MKLSCTSTGITDFVFLNYINNMFLACGQCRVAFPTVHASLLDKCMGNADICVVTIVISFDPKAGNFPSHTLDEMIYLLA